MLKLKLYLVTNEDVDGNNLDAFVWAETLEQAIQLYLPVFDQDTLSDAARVFEVPTTPPPEARALEWYDGVIHVYG
ncbi:hypothetical protein CPT_Seuss111 [Caulobacter phage Seuss]|uniref:Uncharacterized protein n=1 Tax=Caulobacter phage Seuss TaxID=1675601 RepID=A0A0K1LM87_9CAUD|nr:hypothetical protein HOR08_gp111 [Caulobacter phage Seuss]AKU43637.1 hypothetical protein CPT_Seuss111 [Caulobacter phage Seuss]